MSSDKSDDPDPLVMRVQVDDHPVAAAVEADASIARTRYTTLNVRGPVFGIATQSPPGHGHWQVLTPITDGFAQQARDSLNSHLWFKAKDDTDDPLVRRELLAAVRVLETEPVDELTVLDVRYRVVRADEFVFSRDSVPEPPRPTDPEPAVPDWDGYDDTPLDRDFVIDHSAAAGLVATTERLALQRLHYRGERYPPEVRHDSEQAMATHPGVVLLPPAYCVVEHTGDSWTPLTGLMSTPHGARRALTNWLIRFWPLMRDLPEAEAARYAALAREFQAQVRANSLCVDDRLYSVARVGRTVRIGGDGPESARPSDVDNYGPSQIHPVMDEHGTITHEDTHEEE
ncbi:DUF5954 family protein [Streptodolium elevatio]